MAPPDNWRIVMSNAAYFEKPVLLDREKHRASRVASRPGFSFARTANSLYLAGIEFAEACKEYAIVFTRGPNRKILPVAMLGMRGGENLFVDEQDRWAGSYIPAFGVSMHLVSLSNMKQLVDRMAQRESAHQDALAPG
jgi:hypothetical protein